MAEFDLDKMGLDELKALRSNVDRAIASFEDRRRKDALAAAERVARDHGFALADLTGARRARGRRAAAQTPAPRAAGEARFANPDDATQTWSGRGRRPRWVSEQLDAGRSLDDMAI